MSAPRQPSAASPRAGERVAPDTRLRVKDYRLFVRGRRVHHGFFGAALALLGGALMWHDRGDARQWWPARS